MINCSRVHSDINHTTGIGHNSMKSIWITGLVLILLVTLPLPAVCKQPKRIFRDSDAGKWTHIKYDAIKKDIEQETEDFLHLQKEVL